jgi:hypothetical protein
MSQAQLYYQSDDGKYRLYWYKSAVAPDWTSMVLTLPPDESKLNSTYLTSLGSKFNQHLSGGIGSGWLFFLSNGGNEKATNALTSIMNGTQVIATRPKKITPEESNMMAILDFNQLLQQEVEPSGRYYQKLKKSKREYEFQWGSPEQVTEYEQQIKDSYQYASTVHFKVAYPGKMGIYVDYSSFTAGT